MATRSPFAGPGRTRRAIASLAAGVLLVAVGPLAAGARADGNASAAAGFIESAQQPDGGFPAQRGGASDPAASLWASVALLAAGKNPVDERVNNGTSAAAFLQAHVGRLRSLLDLGLLAIVEAASGAAPGTYGHPGTELEADLTPPAIRADPGGAALAVLGLLALHADHAAGAVARNLVGAELTDGGWGKARTSDSVSTALVLQALAQTGVAASAQTAVDSGIKYLHAAQVNDGSIAVSNRTDASSSGDVAATAFTIQALVALRRPMLRTTTGTSVRQGLASYQQMGSGGLSPFGGYDTGVAPSVIQTAQAYPAFDGIDFPLPVVPAQPVAPKTTRARGPNRASAGTASSGIASASKSSRRVVGAYRGATALGSSKSRSSGRSRSGAPSVTGRVVGAGPSPKLTTRAGRAPAKDHTALFLALLLVAVAVLGALLDLGTPRRAQRHPVAAAVQRVADGLLVARRRRALAPATAVLAGLALIGLPVATGLWNRAPQGAALLTAFRPYMQLGRQAHLQAEVETIEAGFGQALAHKRRPEWSAGVSAARQFRGLLDRTVAQRGNYEAVAGLPSLRLFPWLLAGPGAILIGVGAGGLAWPGRWRRLRWAVALLGAALVAGPLALGMFGAAGRGTRLITGFRTIETRSTVVALQNDFSSLVIDQAALASQPPSAVRTQPAVGALNRHWVRILGDFTPLLGVMSDQVARYQAVAELPRFSLFPWFFAAPGIALLSLGLLSGGGRPRLIRGLVPRLKTPIELRSRA